MNEGINLRPAKRVAFCRGCDKEIQIGEELITTYSFRNRGQHIYFCMDCAKKISVLYQVATGGK